MNTRHYLIAVLVPTVLGLHGCTRIGDNSAAVTFHRRVQIGASLAETIIAAEGTQNFTAYFVRAQGCPDQSLEIGHGHEGPPPYIKIVERPVNLRQPNFRAYVKKGYARETFAAAVREQVPTFYACKEFRFIFGRYQGWPRTDSFNVRVDSSGRVVSLTPLEEDPQ